MASSTSQDCQPHSTPTTNTPLPPITSSSSLPLSAKDCETPLQPSTSTPANVLSPYLIPSGTSITPHSTHTPLSRQLLYRLPNQPPTSPNPTPTTYPTQTRPTPSIPRYPQLPLLPCRAENPTNTPYASGRVYVPAVPQSLCRCTLALYPQIPQNADKAVLCSLSRSPQRRRFHSTHTANARFTHPVTG